MQKGFNSDITVRGQKYHIQTEDWGYDNPYIVSRVFQSGAVLKTVKTTYREALDSGSAFETQAIQAALRNQHTKIIDDLMAGNF